MNATLSLWAATALLGASGPGLPTLSPEHGAIDIEAGIGGELHDHDGAAEGHVVSFVALTWAATDRLSLHAPGVVSYRFGEAGAVQSLVWAGLHSVGIGLQEAHEEAVEETAEEGHGEEEAHAPAGQEAHAHEAHEADPVAVGTFGFEVGATTRFPLYLGSAIDVHARLWSAAGYGDGVAVAPQLWHGGLYAAWTARLGRWITMSFGAGVQGALSDSGGGTAALPADVFALGRPGPRSPEATIVVGSVVRRATSQSPLLDVHIGHGWSVGLDGAVSIGLDHGELGGEVLLVAAGAFH